MRVLAVDVGTGTQDILLFDSEEPPDNCARLVMPSPTRMVAEQIREATRLRCHVLLTGVTMGGGPSHWAALGHLHVGLRVYATPAAARTFDDDLSAVEAMGVTLVSEDEANGLRDVHKVTSKDFLFEEIVGVLQRFGAPCDFDRLAVAVFDHGAAPPGVSDRQFRFAYLASRLHEENSLAAFAHFAHEVPSALTRLQAVAATSPPGIPLLLMDTGPAAILGILEDRRARQAEELLAVNIGNFHTLAFHLLDRHVAGLFEHHTGELTQEQLEGFLLRLAQGTITNEEVFASMGHGALVLAPYSRKLHSADLVPFLTLAGPQRGLLEHSGLQPYLAVPHGDMTLAGCFGLLRALAQKDPEAAGPIGSRLGRL